METCRPAFFMLCFTSSKVISKVSASSAAVGGLSNSCSSRANALLILLIEPILFRANEQSYSAPQVPEECFVESTKQRKK
jgi:hypothetical protein